MRARSKATIPAEELAARLKRLIVATLRLEGLEPEAIGDEDIVNYNVPAYRFNGKTYTAIGIDSNGYLVAGGATAERDDALRRIVAWFDRWLD